MLGSFLFSDNAYLQEMTKTQSVTESLILASYVDYQRLNPGIKF